MFNDTGRHSLMVTSVLDIIWFYFVVAVAFNIIQLCGLSLFLFVLIVLLLFIYLFIYLLSIKLTIYNFILYDIFS